MRPALTDFLAADPVEEPQELTACDAHGSLPACDVSSEIDVSKSRPPACCIVHAEDDGAAMALFGAPRSHARPAL